MARRAAVAVLGGTFDRLHAGHRQLLARAFRTARRVGIGVTSDQYLAGHPKPGPVPIEPFSVRRRRLEAFLRRSYPARRWWIVPLEDAQGGAVEPGVEVLVVSSETRAAAPTINWERRRRGLGPLRIETVPLVLGTDLLPVRSRRIRDGSIDRFGRRRRTLRVGVAVPRPLTIAEVASAIRRVFRRVPLRVERFAGNRRSLVAGFEALRHPSRRVRRADSVGGRDYVLAIHLRPYRGELPGSRSDRLEIELFDSEGSERSVRVALKPSVRVRSSRSSSSPGTDRGRGTTAVSALRRALQIGVTRAFAAPRAPPSKIRD